MGDDSTSAKQTQVESSNTSNEDKSDEELALQLQALSESVANEGEIPTEVVEALKDLPPAQKQIVSSMFVEMRGRSSSSSSALFKKLTPEHITQTINNSDKENERDFKKSQASEVTKRWGMGAILALVLMVFGYAGLTKDKDLAEKVIIAGISGLGGFGAGIAVSKKEP